MNESKIYALISLLATERGGLDAFDRLVGREGAVVALTPRCATARMTLWLVELRGIGRIAVVDARKALNKNSSFGLHKHPLVEVWIE